MPTKWLGGATLATMVVVQPSVLVPSTDGVRLGLHDFGGDGPPLLISHATGFNGAAYRPFAEALVDRYRIWAVDYRGHGFSTLPDHGSLAWRGMGEDLLAVLDHLGLRDGVRVAGHSMGGAAAVLAATADPGRISAIWAFEPILVPPPEVYVPSDKSDLAEGAARRRPEFPSLDAVEERYAARPPLSILDRRALRAYIEGGFAPTPEGTVRLRCAPETESATFKATDASGAFAAVASLAVPFLVAISGDGQPPARMGELACRYHPDRTRRIDYPDLTHFGPLEAPDRLAADAADWFASVGA